MGLAENCESLKQRIAAACARVNRTPEEILFLPVSKGHPPESICKAAEFGFQIFGESKVQEARLKISLCSSRFSWHMIGHLQSNKCRDAVQLFQMIQSVDSLSLAEELNKWAEKLGKHVPILLEVNAAGESTKFGLSPQKIMEQIKAFNSLPRLEVQGLMTIAPYSPTPERSRPFFQKLRHLRDECSEQIGAPLPHLSMGMSGDFEVAIEEGSTIVRIGTSLFGERTRLTRITPDHE